MKHISKLLILLAFVVSSNAWGKDTYNARYKFYNAIKDGKINLVRTLVERGVTQTHSSSWTALYTAAVYNQYDIMKLLLASRFKQDINNQVYIGRTVLHVAVSNDSPRMVLLLLEYGINPNIQNDQGDTALHWAVHNHNRQIVQDIIAGGANVTIRNNKGRTALMDAVAYHSKYTAVDLMRAQSTIMTKIISIKQLSNNMLQINWSVNDNIPLEFKLEHSTNVSGPYSSQTISSNSRTFYLYNMKPGKTHFFRLKARDKNGWGESAKMTLIIPKRSQ